MEYLKSACGAYLLSHSKYQSLKRLLIVTIGAMPEDNKSLSNPQGGPNFETGLEELERIVKELEKGDLSLERSLFLFESGMKLSGDCKKMLEEAETRVEILTRRGAEMVPVPFNVEKP
jgi:exodeoxyribonuclease VII small subunit